MCKRLLSLCIGIWLALGLAGCRVAPSSSSAASAAVSTAAGTTTSAMVSTTAIASTSAPASATERTTLTSTSTAPPPATTTGTAKPTDTIQAAAALAYDVTHNRLLFGKNERQALYPASTTKLLTAVVALRHCPEEEPIAVEEETLALKAYDASTAGLKPGMRLTMRQLLDALLLRSGCDAAYVLAEHIGRRIAGDDALPTGEAVAAFIKEMNAVAKSLGAADSHFVNPDGYPHPEHLSTAYDLLLIAQCARTYPTIREIVAMSASTQTLLSGETMTWSNSNRMMQADNPYYYPGVDGMKSGYCKKAGFCMVISMTKGGGEYIAVVLGSPSDAQKWKDLTVLLNECG